jgi:hypothetical protein
MKRMRLITFTMIAALALALSAQAAVCGYDESGKPILI